MTAHSKMAFGANRKQAGGNHAGSVPRFKPFRDRGVRVTGVVACPECKAGVDDRCVASTGAIKTQPHVARRRLALRIERENGTLA